MKRRLIPVGLALLTAILIAAAARASGTNNGIGGDQTSLQAVGKVPSNPQEETRALAAAIASPGRSIDRRILLADGMVVLDPAQSSDTSTQSRADLLAQFRQSGLLGQQTAAATPDVRLVRLTRPKTDWKNRLVWAAIMVGVPNQLGAIGPAPGEGEDANSTPPLTTVNTIAFYDAGTGRFLMAVQETS